MGMIAKMSPMQATLIRQHECKWTNHVSITLYGYHGYHVVIVLSQWEQLPGGYRISAPRQVTRSLFEMKEFPDLIENGVMSLTYIFTEETGVSHSVTMVTHPVTMVTHPVTIITQ